MQYCHTQKGRFHYLLYLTVVGSLAGAWLVRDQPVPMGSLLGFGVVMYGFAQAFHYMTVCDEGEWLAIRFGPLPLLRKRIRYADVIAVEADQTTLLDGWGIHWVPGRGPTYNIWSYECVKLSVGQRTIRIGSDDVENLVHFLRSRIKPPE